MGLQAKHHRDDRRRRLLTDELAFAEPPPVEVCAAEEETPPRKLAPYGDAAFMERHLRLLDIVPRRLVLFLLPLVAGLILVAGLEAAYGWMVDLPEATRSRLGALDLRLPGSLAAWFSSLALVAAAGMAVMIYTIRRYKTDDYHGLYRIWLWTALAALLVAADQASGLHAGLQAVMIHLTGTRLWSDGALWWIVPYFFLLGAVVSRLVVEMWPCRLSTAAVLTTLVCYAVSLPVQLGWIRPPGVRAVMFEVGLRMVGNLLLLLALGLHARYVILDVEGLIPPRPAKEKKPKPAKKKKEPLPEPVEEEAADDETWQTVDPPHPTPQPVFARATPATAPVTAPTAPAVSNDYGQQEPLSKAERKALRKRLEQQRSQREQQQRSSWK